VRIALGTFPHNVHTPTPLFHTQTPDTIKAGEDWITSKPILLFSSSDHGPRDDSKPSLGVRSFRLLVFQPVCECENPVLAAWSSSSSLYFLEPCGIPG
jgi:hypothetical protein